LKRSETARDGKRLLAAVSIQMEQASAPRVTRATGERHERKERGMRGFATIGTATGLVIALVAGMGLAASSGGAEVTLKYNLVEYIPKTGQVQIIG
jgi:hypothetical protein